MSTPLKRSEYPEAGHIVALGSPWTDACGMVLLSSSDYAYEINNLARTSCSTEMALEPLRKILERIRESHLGITRIHPALLPVADHINEAVEAIKRAEDCYEVWRNSA